MVLGPREVLRMKILQCSLPVTGHELKKCKLIFPDTFGNSFLISSLILSCPTYIPCKFSVFTFIHWVLSRLLVSQQHLHMLFSTAGILFPLCLVNSCLSFEDPVLTKILKRFPWLLSTLQAELDIHLLCTLGVCACFSYFYLLCGIVIIYL